MNLNEAAREVSKMDEGNINLNISEIKRAIKCICILMYKNPLLISKMISNGKKNKGVK